MASISPRNSYRSSNCPEVPSQQPRSSWYSEQLEPEGPSSRSRSSHHGSSRPSSSSHRSHRESERPSSSSHRSHRESEYPSSSSHRSHRESERPSSSSHRSHRESGHPSSSARSSHHESDVPSSRIHSSSSIRRANTTVVSSSKNPFARLVATGDLPRNSDPFSQHGSSRDAQSSGSLHRSNAVHSRSRSSHQSSSRCSSSASTIRGPSSTVHGSSPSSMDEHLDSYTGALVPQRSQTVAQRLSPDSRYYSSKKPARSCSTSSSCASECTSSKTSSKGQNVTYNITNINIGSNNIGKGADDLASGFSTIKIGGSSASGRRGRSKRSHTSSGSCTPYSGSGKVWESNTSSACCTPYSGTGKVWDYQDDESLEEMEKERDELLRAAGRSSSELAAAEEALRESEENYLMQFGHPCPKAMFT